MKEMTDFLRLKILAEENEKNGFFPWVGMNNDEYSFYTLARSCIGNKHIIDIMVENGLLGGSFQNGNNH